MQMWQQVDSERGERVSSRGAGCVLQHRAELQRAGRLPIAIWMKVRRRWREYPLAVRRRLNEELLYCLAPVAEVF